MTQFKITHDRPNCIGCTACASVCPKFWEMNAEDGKSDLVGATVLENGTTELIVEEKAAEENQNAVDVCPVNVIHIQEL